MKREGKKIITTIIGIIIAVVGILGMALNLKAEDTAGKLTLNKTAVATENRKAKVTLEIETSKLKQSTADIIIVMDRSGSMAECAETSTTTTTQTTRTGENNHQKPGNPGGDNSNTCDSRLDVAKEAAIDLAEELLPSDASGNVKIGIVTFGTNYESQYSTTSYDDMSSNLETVKAKINSIDETSNNGTNVQAGLTAAKNLLSSSTSDTKIVILISDGVPTYFTLNSNELCGAGSEDKLAKDDSQSCKNSKLIPSTAAEAVADVIKGSTINAEIYAVGFGASAADIASFLTNQVASTATDDKTYAYSASDTEALKTAMSNIAKSIKNVLATNAIVTDIIPASFNLTVEAKEALLAKYGDNITITDNEDGTTTLAVKYAEISSVQGTYVIEYEVIADEDHYGAMYTNVEATLTATATEDNTYYQDKNIELTFNKPVVAISMVTKDDDYTTNEKYIAKEGSQITIDTTDSILNNDSLTVHTDRPSDTIIESTVSNEIVIESNPTCGTLTVNEDGTFTYAATEGCAGEENQTYTVDYHVVSTVTINSKEYKVTSNTSTITLKVVKNPTSYTVKYLEKETNKELADTKIVTNKYVYDTVTEEAKSITGYNLVEGEESSKTIKLVEDTQNNVIIFYYIVKPADIEDPIFTKVGPASIATAEEAVDYTITYETSINDYKGTATITLVDTLPYTIDESKSELDGGTYDEATKTITWTILVENIDTYKNGAKDIKITKKISVFYNYPEFTGTETEISNTVSSKVQVDTAPEKNDEITEDTPVDIKGKLVVEHKYVDENGEEQELVPTQPATEEKVGTSYTTSPEQVDGYKVSVIPENANGKYVEGTTTVTYYYERVEAEITDTKVNKTSETEEITSSTDKVTYNVTYSATIKEYNGPVTITIIDTLPYEIDESKSTLVSGDYIGEYDATKKTITWIITKTVDTYTNKPEGESTSIETISISLEYTVVYKDLDASADKVTNKVSGTIKVETTNPIDSSDSEDVPVNITGKVITHHVDKDGNTLSSDVTTEDKVGKTYTTSSVEIPGYKLTVTPENKEGQYIEGTIEVTYVYERLGATPTEPVTTKSGTSKIASSKEENTYTITYDAIVENYKGTITVTIVDFLPYALNEEKTNDLAGGTYDASNQTITWVETYENEDASKNIEIDITKNIRVNFKDIDASVENYTNKVVVTLKDDVEASEDTITEATHTTDVNIKGTVTTYYYEKSTTEELANSVSTTDKVGDTYTTEVKDIEGYELVAIPNNATGKYTEEDIIVIYEYTKKVADITDEDITKKSVLEEITASNTLVDYQISYKTKINDYKGTATITIVDYLPYAIDEKSSNLDGGIYNKENKTITWTDTIEGINTFQNGTYSVNITKNIVVKYSNIASDKTVVNKVEGKIKTDTKDSTGKEATEEIITAIKGDLIVKHIYKDKDGNKKVLETEPTKTDYVGYTYTTEPKQFNGYTLSETPSNKTGEYKEEDTIVIYYYDRTPAEVKENIVKKESTNKVVTNINNAFNYTIKYNTTLNEYEGTAIITIVDQLSYPIDEEKSELNGGTYNSKDLTITWIKEYDVNTYENKNNTIEVNISLSLYYKDITSDTKVVTNTVNTKLDLETINPIETTDKTETTLEIKGTVIANYVDRFGNKIATSENYTGLVGESYQTKEKEIENYILSKVEGNTEGTYIDGKIIVTYYYDLEGTGSVEPPQTNVDNSALHISLISSVLLIIMLLLKKKILA